MNDSIPSAGMCDIRATSANIASREVSLRGSEDCEEIPLAGSLLTGLVASCPAASREYLPFLKIGLGLILGFSSTFGFGLIGGIIIGFRSTDSDNSISAL